MNKKLTDTQREVLAELDCANHTAQITQKWCTPLDIGGGNGSHHSGCLAALARKGLVQFRQRGGPEPDGWENGGKRWASRGSKSYRITPAGRLALAAPAPKGET